jgi:ferredoxin-NADP reductase
MRALPDSEISEEDSRIIVSYLASQMAPKGAAGSAGLEVARALVDQRCGRCHSLDRVYRTAQTPQEWSDTVTRMASYAAGSAGAFQPGEDQQIIAYLSARQTPDAVDQRKARAAAASSAGRSLVAQKVPAELVQTKPRGGYDSRMIGFISVVLLGLLTLIIRRPARAPIANATSDRTAAAAVRATASSLGRPLVLRLASITMQTSDSKTLRFIVPNDQTLSARPGQFLTFSFLFDGKKVTRSYSICSSPARSGYVEITPKRVSQGCASVFLNDRASVGMTVEAKGPFGHFCFDESKHRSVVLLAAGSGITPMMAMLRYMDDLCLETTATLLYCVRSGHDIIFAGELEQLQSRLKNFQYHVLLSQPHAEWSGPRGHVSREFIEDTVKDLTSADFFLCGPPLFMDASRSILTGLGVKPERIRQESFGASAPKKLQPDADDQSGVTVEFVRSGKTCVMRIGQTVLEAAEEQGVPIPSSCRQGQCGTCRTKLLEGDVRMDAEEGLDPDSRAQGFVLTCVGRAHGAVKLDV